MKIDLIAKAVLILFLTGFSYLSNILGDWSSIEPRVTDKSIKKFFFLDDTHCWGAGTDGVIIHSKDGGRSWVLQNSTTVLDLNDIHFTDRQNGWAVGHEGCVLRTKNGGDTWENQLKRTSSMCTGVFFSNPDTGIIVSYPDNNYLLFRTNDGGKTWLDVAGKLPTSTYIISFINLNQIFVSSNDYVNKIQDIYFTENAGLTWAKVGPGDSLLQDDISGMFFFNRNLGWVYYRGNGLYKTVDGGNTWNHVSALDKAFEYVVDGVFIHFFTSEIGCIVGDSSGGSKVMVTRDGGETWHCDNDFPAFNYAQGMQYDKLGNIWIGSYHGAIHTTMDTASLSSSTTLIPRRGNISSPESTVSKYFYLDQSKYYNSDNPNRYNISGRMCRKSSRNRTLSSGIIIEKTNHKVSGKTQSK